MPSGKHHKTRIFIQSPGWIVISGLFIFMYAATATNTVSNLDIQQIEKLLVEEAFERSKWMIRASHILIGVPENATQADKLQALSKVTTIRESIVKGTSFSKAAIQFSDSPSVMEDSGDLGFFTVFEQFYPIETAAFTLEPGDISAPVKSRFGYHLITVTERITIQKEKRVAHLLIEDLSPAGKAKAIEILQLIPEHSFEKLVKEYSDDVMTRESGGDLGSDRLVNALESVRLRLELNQVSKPVKTIRGWHILKVTEEAEETTLAAKYDLFRQKIEMDSRPQRILNAIKQQDTFYPVARDMQ